MTICYASLECMSTHMKQTIPPQLREPWGGEEKTVIIDDFKVKCLICTVFNQIITHIESSWICINLITRNEKGS